MRKFLTFIFLLVLVAWNSYGQVASSYAFTAKSASYTPITGGTVWQTGTWDDVTTSIPVGFNFTANGSTFSALTISTNGYLHTGTGSLGYTPISSGTAAGVVFAPMGRDLQGLATSEIRYETTGSAPDRVFTAQWKDAKRYGSSYADEILNFQVKFYETSNKIEFVYGATTGSAYATPTHPQVGLRGSANTDFFNRTSTLGWNSSTAGLTNTATMTLTSAYAPASGLTYAFEVSPPVIVPGIAAGVTPASGATGVVNNTQLIWTAPVTGGLVQGYKVYLGTDNPPTNVVNGDITVNTNYTPAAPLGLLTAYNWKIVPFNVIGDAVSVPTWSFTTFAGFGSLEGIVKNYNGVPIAGATVAAIGSSSFNTTSDINGFYQFLSLPAATYTVGAQAATYNTTSIPGVIVNASVTTTQDIVLLQPSMNIAPDPNHITVNPNEVTNNPFTITNLGTGTLGWTASIGNWSSANHSWFSMPTLSGSVNAAQIVNVPAVFDASGLPIGTILSADVTFVSTPDVGTKTVQVQMIVAGEALVPVSNLVATLTNQFTGDVTLTWECTPSAGLLYYNVERDGVTLAALPAATTYNDVLPTYGTYNYCVNAVYSDGTTAPVCASIEWANPTMTWTPAALANTQPSGSTESVLLTLGNTGLGTLAFEFPDYSDNSGDSPLAYCTATATACDEYIGNVTIGTINNSTGCNYYTNYSALTTDLVKGESVAMTATNGGNAYASDYLYVWIDYDHNDVFDASELTQLATLGGGSNFSGNITVPPTAMSGPTTMRVRMSYATSANPCGSQTYGEVEDYSVTIKAPTFITAVTPASGFVAPVGTQPVNVYFSATDDYSPAGVYVNQLALESNDLANPAVSIPCTMTVYIPGTVSGVVTDGVSGDLLPGVMVSDLGGTNVAMTGDNGEYTLVLQAGTYDLTFSKIGYQNATSTGVVVTAGNATTVDAQLFEMPYAPSCASAVVNAEDTQSTVTWCLPAGPYELLYDDGTAENFAAWQLAGNMNAVKFTPKGYPAHVVGAKLFVGDGSFPAGGVVNGAEFGVAVYSADANGMPGMMLDSVPASVTNFGWVNVTGLDALVNTGDFFIVMIQGSMSPDCAPIGVDETQPKAFKSYSRNVGTNSPWVLSPYQDFMMHAVVSGPMSGDDAMEVAVQVVPGKVAGMISQNRPMAVAGKTGMSAMVTAPEGYDNMDMVNHYSLSRISLGPVTPVAPAAGVFTLLNNNITATTYTEGGTTWSALPQGWYAYGVKAVYPNLQESEFVYTNAVPHKMFADVTVNVELICGFVPAEGAFVSLTGNDYPYDVHSATVPASGTVFFDNVIKGVYDLLVTRAGYYATSYKVTITGDKTIDVVLEDLRYMPRNLTVDCGTLVATWEEPLAVAVQENFEGGVFPPAGWQATTQGSVGWYATTDGGSAYFPIPGHTTYAVANDDEGGSANNGSVDYLITPELDLTGAPSYVLSFQSYYDGGFGHMAYVEMSTDGGASWTPIYTCEPATTWQQVDVDLSAYSGASGLGSVWFAFHSDDAGQWAAGWAVDDVMIASGGVPVQGYGVFLDGTEVAQTQELTYTFDPATITYWQTYVAGVAGLYCSGYSELETYTFTSCFLYPPRNLEGVFNGSTTSGAVILTWEAPMAGDKGMSYLEYITLNNITPFENNAPTSYGVAPFINQATLPAVTDAMSVATTKAWGALYQDSYVTFTLDNPGTFTAFGSATPNAFVMEAEIINGVYYACDENGSWFSMDTVTGVITTLGSTGNSDLSALAYDATTSILYGIDFNGGFFTVDIATGALTSIGSTNATVIAASCDAAGNLYAVDMTSDEIGMVDKTTGAWTTMVALGFDANFGQDMTTDFQTNTLYYGAYNNSLGAGQEYTYEPATNALTLVGNFEGNAQLMGFAVPVITNGTNPITGLLSYNLYRDDVIVASIPKEELTYWDLNLLPATYCYDITAVYDIEPYGFPAGTTGESVKEGTVCVDVMYGFELPFMEDWTTGQFDVNLWTVGDNWIMDGQAGNEMPSAKFKWDPLLTDYSSSLESFYMNAAAINTTTPYKIWLDFDLKLDDRTASTMEMLTVEVWNGSSWSEVKEYTNNGDFDWTAEHVNISSAAKGNVFKVRFRANGDLTGDIFYWSVDNIHIYVGYEFMPPLNLVATPEGAPQNDIKLTWSAPEGGGTVMTYVLDDNSAENGWGINAGAEAWLGNEFVVTETGVLQSLDLYFQTNAAAGSYPMTVDIFDASQTLVGTSASFVAVADSWVTVALNDVPYSGTFYAMVHYNMLPGANHWFGSDENGPNAAANYGWYYDGAAWAHLSDFGYAPNVFMIRAKALVGGDKAVATYGTASISHGGSASAAGLLSKSDVSSSAGVPVSSSAIYLGDNSDALTGYNVWRRAYAVFPAGSNTAAAGEFVKINTAIVVPTEYLDMNLSNLETNCYEYQVTAVYTEGESDPSNIDWKCIFVGVDPNETNEVKVYPNPATTYVRIDLTKEVTQISVYNSLGAVVADKNVKGETTITLNTANYASGAYSVKFTTASGESFSRKFVVTK